jgi:hypothetical protein
LRRQSFREKRGAFCPDVAIADIKGSRILKGDRMNESEFVSKMAESAASNKESTSDGSAAGNSLEELIEQKRKQWQNQKRDQRKNRLEGLWMSLFGLAVISLGFIIGGDQLNHARVMIVILGFAVTVFGIYFMVTGQRMPEDSKPGGD